MTNNLFQPLTPKNLLAAKGGVLFSRDLSKNQKN